MNNRGNNEFDELEPRVTPQPTLLKCMTPSVPEVSLIFGRRPEPTQHLKKPRNPPEEEFETYASWKKDEFSSAIDPRHTFQLLNKSTNNKSLVPLNSSSNKLPNFPLSESPLKNPQQNHLNQSKTPSTRDPNAETPPRNRIPENLRFHNYKHASHTEISAFPENKSADSPGMKRSYEGVKSILKSSMVERNEVTNPATNPDCRFERKPPSQISQTQRNILDYSHQSPVPRCHRQIDANLDHGTVQDLLLLVQNQNEQIKSLQNQVERLLQAHEESIGNRDNRTAVSKQSNSQQLPVYDQDRHSGMNPHPSEEPPEMCLRYPGDQMRNAIMEKKVSIGVMTSFEFSVHNNPFVSDSDQQINAVLRECGKNIVDSPDNWRRNIAPGPLENINEDSESYPSSLWKQSNNNTQMSSNSKRTAATNESPSYNHNMQNCSPRSQDSRSQSRGNSSGNFFTKATQPPVPAPRKLSSSNRSQKQFPVASEHQMQNLDNFPTSGFNNVAQRESYDSHRLSERNNYNRASPEGFTNPHLQRNDRIPKNLESLNPNMKSIAVENTDEASLVLSSSELRVTERPPSPDPSIHVEMREYSSDDENEKSKRAPPVGWTFYKNVVGQVNRILHTIPDTKDMEENEQTDRVELQNEVDGREEVVDSVKLATMERLKMLGISYAEHSEFMGEHIQKKVTFDSSYCPRLDYQTTLPQPPSTVTESNTSMHMKALALKYLSDEQLADLAVQKQGDGSGMKQKILNSVHGTNMSLATMNYLQRYCLVSGVNSPHSEGKGHVNAIRQKKLKHMVMTKELHAQQMPRHHAHNDSANNKREPDNILDITTLKQQPKLL